MLSSYIFLKLDGSIKPLGENPLFKKNIYLFINIIYIYIY